jgi:hypothetical protein
MNMPLSEAMILLDKILPQSLNDLHAFVFQQTWEGKSYAEMANISAYDEKYIKSVGSAIWKMLSKEMNQNVTKSNLRSSLEAYARNKSKLEVFWFSWALLHESTARKTSPTPISN